jgi:hypothetical protein
MLQLFSKVLGEKIKLELDGSLENAPLKGCLWMGEKTSEGAQDETSQQPKPLQNQYSNTKTHRRDCPYKFHYS